MNNKQKQLKAKRNKAQFQPATTTDVGWQAFGVVFNPANQKWQSWINDEDDRFNWISAHATREEAVEQAMAFMEICRDKTSPARIHHTKAQAFVDKAALTNPIKMPSENIKDFLAALREPVAVIAIGQSLDKAMRQIKGNS